MANHNLPINPRLIIPASFGECLTYEEQVCFLAEKLIEAIDNINDLETRVRALEGDNQ